MFAFNLRKDYMYLKKDARVFKRGYDNSRNITGRLF